MERQIHGFIYENEYIIKNRLIKEENYTSEYDAYDENGVPYQIKLIKKGSSIDLGDFFRNMGKSSDFYMVIAFWCGDRSNRVEEYKIFIDKKFWNDILYFDRHTELREWISNVSNDVSYDKIWKKEMSEWKKLFGKRYIQLRFKRDHKTQKRIQCAINNKDFYGYFLKELSYE